MSNLEKNLKHDLDEANRSYEQHVANRRRRQEWEIRWKARHGERPASAVGLRTKR